MNKDGFLCVETPKLLKLGLDPDSVQQILKNAELRMSFGVARPRAVSPADSPSSRGR
jgi:hypothetical protein